MCFLLTRVMDLYPTTSYNQILVGSLLRLDHLLLMGSAQQLFGHRSCFKLANSYFLRCFRTFETQMLYLLQFCMLSYREDLRNDSGFA